ncbi:MAG: hypothetical protein KTR16_04535 [Acidiferrobacterales bacterium]|nr:hypothetical protein [Acidiferrobacterales bacterium]
MRSMMIFNTVLLGFTVCAQAAAPKSEVFGSLPKIFDAAISPEGNCVAMIRMDEAASRLL